MLLGNIVLFFFELVVLVLQTGNYLSRPKDQYRRRFLYSTLIFVLFNAIWLYLQYTPLHFNELLNYAIANMSGVLIGVYYYRYINFENQNKPDSIDNRILWSVIGTTVITTALAYFATQSIHTTIFIVCLTLVAIFFTLVFSAAHHLFDIQSKTAHPTKPEKGLVAGLVIMVAIPVLTILQVRPEFISPIANILYVLLLTNYIKSFRYQRENEIRLLNMNMLRESFSAEKEEAKSFLEFEFKSLTSREKIIAYQMLEGLLHSEIAELSITDVRTITSQASKIYKKTNCTKGKRKQFIEKYQPYYERINTNKSTS